MRRAAVCVLFVAAVAVAGVGAQNTTPPATTEQPQVYRTTGTRIGIVRSLYIAADEEVRDGVVVIGGSVRVDGRVRQGVVVVGGNLEIGPRAFVSGDVVVVGGSLTRAPGAEIRGTIDQISIGDWGSWSIGGFTVPSVEFGDVGQWLTLFGTLFRVAVLAVLMALFIGLARAPVARIGRSAGAEPGRALALGIAAAVLFVPLLVVVCIGLIVTIIGIPVAALLIPLAVLAAFIALLLGFTAIACRLGEWVQDRLGWRAHSALLATAIGLLLLVLPTMIARLLAVTPAPLGLVTWSLLVTGILIESIAWLIGLGATLMTGFGRWSTAPPPVPPAVAHADIAPAAG